MFRYFAFIFVLTLVSVYPAISETRAAFIVGNSAYENAPPLSNPVRDARLVGDTLASLGFDVTRHQDLTRESFSKALGAFLKKSRDADVTFFYFAGHGMQYDGQNYLVGTDAELISELDIEGETIALNKVVELLERNSKAALIFVDACRDNPLATDFYRRNFSETRALNTRGLARVRSRIDGSMLVFAAGPGQVAYDGDGRNSPFAEALARHLPTPGKEVLSLTKRIIGDVREATDGAQSPIVTNDLTREIFLREAALRPDTSLGTSLAKEQAVYDAALKTNTLRAWAQYFDQYPNGQMRTAALSKETALLRDEIAEVVKHRAAGLTKEATERESRQINLEMFGIDRIYAIAIQATLSRLGYDTGPTDGQFGAKTISALTDFQMNAGLVADGVVDRATLAALGMRTRGSSETNRYAYSSFLAKRHTAKSLELLETDPRIRKVVREIGYYNVVFGEYQGRLFVGALTGTNGNFDSANKIAERVGGYLATLNSKEENEFAFRLVMNDRRFWQDCPRRFCPDQTDIFGPAFGLYQKEGSPEPRGGWSWSNGEPLEYTNWLPQHPRNWGGNSNLAVFFYWPWANRGQRPDYKDSRWADIETIQGSILIEIE